MLGKGRYTVVTQPNVGGGPALDGDWPADDLEALLAPIRDDGPSTLGDGVPAERPCHVGAP